MSARPLIRIHYNTTMSIENTKHVRIIPADYDHGTKCWTAKQLNRRLEAGWKLIHVFTESVSEERLNDGQPSFVIAWQGDPNCVPPAE